MANLFTVLDNLHQILSTNLPSDVTVVDGPKPSGNYKNKIVFVGYVAGDADFDTLSSTANQDWHAVGRLTREENLTVNCTAVVTYGGKTFPEVRAIAQDLFLNIESTLVSNRTLNLPPPARAHISQYQLFQASRDRGVVAQMPFDVSVFTYTN